jgi:hypothetical protein
MFEEKTKQKTKATLVPTYLRYISDKQPKAREKKQRKKRQESRAFPLCFFVKAFELKKKQSSSGVFTPLC